MTIHKALEALNAMIFPAVAIREDGHIRIYDYNEYGEKKQVAEFLLSTDDYINLMNIKILIDSMFEVGIGRLDSNAYDGNES